MAHLEYYTLAVPFEFTVPTLMPLIHYVVVR